MIDVKIERSGESNDTKYPYIGVSDCGNDIVLFIRKETGFIIYSGHKTNPFQAGYFCEDWAEHAFTPFKGSITLSNK